jgi:hypothetical protein
MTTLVTCYLWCIIQIGQTEYRKRIDCLIDRAQIYELDRMNGKKSRELRCEKR